MAMKRDRIGSLGIRWENIPPLTFNGTVLPEPDVKILVDENMPYAEALFGRLGAVQTVAGMAIPAPALAQAYALMVRLMTRGAGDLLAGSR